MPLGVLSVLIVVLTILVVVQGLALLELVRQFAQLRQRIDFGDQPSAYPTPVGLQISVAPELLTSSIRRALESDQAALVLLSVNCLTCTNVASGWSRVERFSRQGFVLLPILHARSFQEAKRFIEASELQEKATVLDLTGLLSDAIGRQAGLNTRPAVVILEHGRLWSIDIVRSAPQLADVLARVCAREGVPERNGLDQIV